MSTTVDRGIPLLADGGEAPGRGIVVRSLLVTGALLGMDVRIAAPAGLKPPARYGWTMAVDADRWRRVVPSPEPLRVIEEDAIRAMVDRDVVVVCGGGGGAPVTEDRIGRLTGVEAVVDNDMTAAQVALALGADWLLVLTDVPAIIRGYRTPQAGPIRAIDADTVAELPFPAGSMGPKVDACMWFARTSGQPAAVGALAGVADVLAGHAGTTIAPALLQVQAAP